MEITNKWPFDGPQYNLKNMTLLFVEGPDAPNAQNIKSCLNAALLDKYELSMDHFFRGFTIVTDGAAVMAKVANASVSWGIHPSYETWMSCMAHSLNDVMKSVLSCHCHGPNLEVATQDVWSIKRIIEGGNRSGRNHSLPNGYKLLQEKEPRFGTNYQVSERFLKTANYRENMVDSNLGSQARAGYCSLKEPLNIDGIITGYLDIEAILDAFGVVVDCIERFETSSRPTMHIARQIVYRMVRTLEDV